MVHVVAVRRRGVYLQLVPADMFGVILDISAEADSKDADDDSEEAAATERGRLLPGDGGQIMVGMASGDICALGRAMTAAMLAVRERRFSRTNNYGKFCKGKNEAVACENRVLKLGRTRAAVEGLCCMHRGRAMAPQCGVSPSRIPILLWSVQHKPNAEIR